MNVLYLTVPSYFDLDTSFVREMDKLSNMTVLLVLSPKSKKSSAFSIDKLDSKCDVIQASNYSGFEKYSAVLNLDKWFIANNPDNSIFSCIRLFFKIKKFIKKNKIDLIHTTTMCKTVFFFTPFLFLFPYTLLTVHDPIPHNNLSWYEKLFRRKIFFKANKKLLFLSKIHLHQFCVEYGFSEENIFFSRLSAYDIFKNYALSKNPYGMYILFFGRIEPYKGVELLIDAFEKSNLSQNGVKLVIAGKGKIKYGPKSNDNNIIILNRFIPNEELASLIFHCKYVVLPYISATQSGCVMSAYAFNKPILATSVGNLPVDVENDVTGLICEPNNVDDLVKKMDAMNSLDLSRMSQNINEMYQEGGALSWFQIAKDVKSIYESVKHKS